MTNHCSRLTAVVMAGLLALSASESQAAPATPVKPSAPQTSITVLDTSDFPVGTVVSSYNLGVLSHITMPEGQVVQVLRLSGTPNQMGIQYGRLLGGQVFTTWSAMMTYMGEQLGLSSAQAEQKLASMLDRAWGYMTPYVSTEFNDELEGVITGAKDAGFPTSTASGLDMRTVLRRMVALTNVSDLNAYANGSSADANKMMMTGTSSALDAFYQSRGQLKSTSGHGGSSIPLPGRTCSFFAAWGSRTDSGRLLASRNLDWTSNTGLERQSLITVYKPTDGTAYATMGYVGVLGAMAGINAHGLVVSEVGSTSTLEKLKGQPWTYKLREVLSKASTLEQAMPLMTNYGSSDRVNRPTTLGYNFLIADGDVDGRGANAKAAVLESNGGMTMAYTYGTSREYCSESALLYVYNRDGKVLRVDSPTSSRFVNGENSAMEIDAVGNVRKFKVSNGEFVRSADGYYIEDAYGSPMQTGRTMSCGVYRGEEAMGYGPRMYQTAANGPSGLDPRAVMNDSESYLDRYGRLRGVLNAFATGSAYTDSYGTTWVEPAMSGKQLTLNEAEVATRASAMDTNIMGVTYDATALKVRVAYEAQLSSGWSAAADNSAVELDMALLFNW